MNNPKVTVIVPVYNVEQYLVRCLDSICSQSYSNLEIIVVDDGSSDRSGIMCDEYAMNDDRIRLVHQMNKGLSEARNTALRMATGDYILLIDSDDWIDINMIECLIAKITEYRADLCCYDLYVSYDGGESVKSANDGSVKVFDKKEALRLLVRDEIKSYSCLKMYRTSLFENVQFPAGRRYEDVGTVYRTFLKAEKVIYYHKALYHYYQRSGSITRSYQNIERLIDD